MQGRFGPPVLQPFYDVLKLREKENITVNRVQDFYVICFLYICGGSQADSSLQEKFASGDIHTLLWPVFS
jgi:hypothetical protein